MTRTAIQAQRASTPNGDPVYNSNTNIHDWIRVIELFYDPRLQAAWSEAHMVLDRVNLDDNGRITPWEKLIEAFNDYELYNYKNCCVVLSPEGTPVPVAGLEVPFSYRKAFDPCLGSEKRPQRDVAWLKDKVRTLKGEYVLAITNYLKSGNQDAEDP